MYTFENCKKKLVKQLFSELKIAFPIPTVVEKKHFAPFVQNIVFFLLLPLFLPTNWTQLEVFPGTEGKRDIFW